MARIDAMREAFRNWRLTNPALRVTSPAAGGHRTESDGRWLLVYTDLLYRYDFIA